MRTKTSKQQVAKDGFRFSGNEHGVLTRIEAVVLSIEFVDGMVEATVQMASSEPMKIRFTYKQALAADIIEKVE